MEARNETRDGDFDGAVAAGYVVERIADSGRFATNLRLGKSAGTEIGGDPAKRP